MLRAADVIKTHVLGHPRLELSLDNAAQFSRQPTFTLTHNPCRIESPPLIWARTQVRNCGLLEKPARYEAFNPTACCLPDQALRRSLRNRYEVSRNRPTTKSPCNALTVRWHRACSRYLQNISLRSARAGYPPLPREKRPALPIPGGLLGSRAEWDVTRVPPSGFEEVGAQGFDFFSSSSLELATTVKSAA